MEKIIEKIKTEIEKGVYKYYGLRSDNNYEEWQTSRIWDLGEPTESCHSGLCVIRVTSENVEKALKLVFNYHGDNLYFLGADEMYDGEDMGEIILDEFSHKLICQIN